MAIPDTIQLSCTVEEETFVYILQYVVGANPYHIARYIRCKRYGTQADNSAFYHSIKQFRRTLPNGFKSFYVGYLKYDYLFTLDFVISPTLLVLDRDFCVNLLNGTPENINLFISRFEDAIRQTFPLPTVASDTVLIDYENLYSFDKAFLRRVDCAFNFQVDDYSFYYEKSLASLYIFLLNASSRSYKTLKLTSTSKSRYKKNCVRYANNSVSVTIYDKYRQVESRYSKYDENFPEFFYPAEAIGVLRYEVQLKRKKIKDYINKYGYRNRDFLTEEFNRSQLTFYAEHIFFPGDFVNRPQTEKALRDTELKPAEVNKTLNFLDEVALRHSVHSALEKIKLSPATISKRFQQCQDANIQPYLLPVNKYRDYKLSDRLKEKGVLPGLLSQLYA